MFGLFKRKPPLNKIETLIGSNTSFNGHLKCDGNVRIDGLCEGGIIETVGNVVVAPEGRVAATIIAEHVSVAGEVTGAIQARGRLEILSTGRVMGNVQVANFYKDESGILGGRLVMGEEEAEPTQPVSEVTPEEDLSGAENQATDLVKADDEPDNSSENEESAGNDTADKDAK